MKTKGRKTEGFLILRPNGIYQARWTFKGKKYQRSTGETDKAKAEKKLAEFLAPYRLGDEHETTRVMVERLAGTEEKTIPLEDAFETFRSSLYRRAAKDSTMLTHGTALSAFTNWAKENAPAIRETGEVTLEVAERFLRDLRAKVSGKTANNRQSSLVHVWDVLHRGTQRPNPWTAIPKTEVDSVSRRELTVEELERVVAGLQGEMKVLFALGIYTGMRLGDCATIEWGNIDLVRGFLDVKTQKTGANVHIAIHPVLRSMLEELPASHEGYVLPGLAKAHLRNCRILSGRIHRIFESAGIQTTEKHEGHKNASSRVGFHSLRHTFVSLCANAKVPLALVQSCVGHKSQAMTMHYFHPSDEALTRAVEALPAIGAASTPGTPATPPHDRITAFKALLEEMTADEREEAKRILAG